MSTKRGQGSEQHVTPGAKPRQRIHDAGKRAGGPAQGMGGQASRVPPTGSLPPSSGDDTQHVNPAPGTEVEVLAPGEQPTLADYKGMSLASIGRDSKGRVIRHTRSEKVARQIRVWVAGGYDVNAICINLNIRPGLLKQLYPVELAIGAEQVGMEMTSHIVQRAKRSDRMAIFFAKAKMGWTEDAQQSTGSLLNINIHI